MAPQQPETSPNPATRGERARRRILEASRRVILEVGPLDFSVEAVAKESGASRSTIYRHWEDGHRLLIDTLESLVPTVTVPDTGSLKGDLSLLIDNLLSVFEDEQLRRLLLDVVRAAAADPELERIRTEAATRRANPIRSVIERAIQRGEVPEDIDIDIALNLVEGPIMARRVVMNRPLTAGAREQMLDRVIAALTWSPGDRT